MLAGYAVFGMVGTALFGVGVGLASELAAGWLDLKRASPMPPAAYLLAKCSSAIAFGIILAGYPLVDIKVTLYDGSYHEVDSNEMAFKFAGSIAFKEAARKASPVLLEPVMAVEVTVPEEHMGTIIGDINSRRGRIEGMEHLAGSQVIKAIVPLKEMFGYVNDIRSSTQGRASYSMQFARYEEAPRMIADEIIGRAQGK